MNSKQITKGDEIKDSTGRWATVLEVRDEVLVVNKFWGFVHTDNVQEIR